MMIFIFNQVDLLVSNEENYQCYFSKKEGSDWGENIPTYFNSIIGNGQRSLQIVSKMLGDTNEELLIMCFDIDYLKKAINCITDPTMKVPVNK